MEKIVAIIGPTAAGKTALAINIAKVFKGEVISADSRQIYRGMNIGTAKPAGSLDPAGALLIEGISHWGIDIRNPDEAYSAAEFKDFAEAKITEIKSRGGLPIIAGGTGLYTEALIDNYQFDSADTKGPSKYQALQIGIKIEKEELYARINARVDQMIEEGLIEEVQTLLKSYPKTATAMTGIGYRQIINHLEGEYDLAEAIRLIKRDTRHYAKRQMTWFKRNDNIVWITSGEGVMEMVRDFIK